MEITQYRETSLVLIPLINSELMATLEVWINNLTIRTKQMPSLLIKKEKDHSSTT